MSHTDTLERLAHEAEDLRTGTARILSCPPESPEAVQEAISLRRMFCIRLKETDALLAREIADLRALRKTLEIIRDYQEADMRLLTDKKWELIEERKQSKFQQSVPSHP